MTVWLTLKRLEGISFVKKLLVFKKTVYAEYFYYLYKSFVLNALF